MVTSRKKLFVLSSIAGLLIIISLAVVVIQSISLKNSYEHKSKPIVIQSNSEPRNKAEYRQLDLTRFNKKYETAYGNNEDWTKDVQKVALSISGYPNIDHILPDKVTIFHTTLETYTIVVQQTTQIFDDSISGREIRVDLVQNGELWDVDWAGGRWRCRPGRGHLVWSPELCY